MIMSVEEKLVAIEGITNELKLIDVEAKKLSERRSELVNTKEKLKSEINNYLEKL